MSTERDPLQPFCICGLPAVLGNVLFDFNFVLRIVEDS